MNQRDETMIAEELAKLAKVEPRAGAAERAVARVRARLEPDLTAPKATSTGEHGLHLHGVYKIAFRGGIAAAIAVVALLNFLPLGGRTANAAEQLEEASRASASFKGWVHVKSWMPWKEGGNPGEPTINAYFDTVAGVAAFQQANGSVSWISSEKRQILNYFPHTHVIGRMVMTDEQIRFAREQFPRMVSVAGVLQMRILAQGGTPGPQGASEVRWKREGDLDRFETVVKPAGRFDIWGGKVTFWVDHQTKYIRRIEAATTQHNSRGDLVGVERDDFSYGDPILHDLYDLGVPRDAKIVDGYTPPSTAIVQVSPALAVGKAAPKLHVKTLDGKVWRLRGQRGKVVLIHFWGTWCSPCVNALPALKELNADLRKKYPSFEMLGICMDDHEDNVRSVIAKLGVDWPQTCDAQDSHLADVWGVRAVPCYFIIDAQGHIAAIGGNEETERENIAKTVARCCEAAVPPK